MQTIHDALPILHPEGPQPFAFNGPFLSGIWLNTHGMLRDGYPDIQKKIGESLAAVDPGWRAYPRNPRSSELVFDVDDYTGSPLLPHYFVEKAVSAGAALEPVQVTETVRWVPESVRIRFCDFGVGIAAVHGTVSGNVNPGTREYRELMERIASGAVGPLDALVAVATGELERAVPPQYLQLGRDLEIDRGTPSRFKKLLWTHRVFHVECDAFSAAHARSFCALLPGQAVGEVPDCSVTEDVAFFPGSGNSLVVYRKDGACTEPQRRVLTDMIELQNVYWTAAYRLNREAFNVITAVSTKRVRAGLSELEEEGDRIIDLQERTTLFRAVIADLSANFSPQSHLLWDGIAAAWRTGPLIDGLREKLETLHEMQTRIVARIAERHSQRLNTLVFVFTLLSLTTLVTAVIDFTQGGPLSAPEIVRFSMLVLLWLLLIPIGRMALKR